MPAPGATSVRILPSAIDSEAAALGTRLRQIRIRNANTLEIVASAAGITTGHLSRIERGEKLPSMGALLRLAAALGVTLADLIGGSPVDGEVLVVRAGERSSLRLNGVEASRYAVLMQQATCAGQSVTSYIIDPAKDLDAIALTFHGGLEFVFVLEGELELELGDAVEILRTGDATLFPGYLKHRLRPVDKRRRSRALIVIVSS